jgi:hypothetical protein
VPQAALLPKPVLIGYNEITSSIVKASELRRRTLENRKHNKAVAYPLECW